VDLVWFWSLTKRHIPNKLCFHQNKNGLVVHALGGRDTVRRLLASGVATWKLTAGQMERLG
jgi:hypothetical protein